MCTGGGSTPAPVEQIVQAAPPAAPAPIQPEAVAPAPEQVQTGETKVLKKTKSKRKKKQQASQGSSALTIPLNTGTTSTQGGSSLNIPK